MLNVHSVRIKDGMADETIVAQRIPPPGIFEGQANIVNERGLQASVPVGGVELVVGVSEDALEPVDCVSADCSDYRLLNTVQLC